VDAYKQSLIRRLKFKSREVSEELSGCKEVYNTIFPLFYCAVTKYCEDNDLPDPFLKFSSIETKKNKSNLTSSLKSIFRKIASKTHTDITQDESSRPILEKAVEAKRDNKSHDLLSIAHKLKIDTSDIDYSSIQHLEDSIISTEKEIENIQHSYPWVWFNSKESKKNSIIASFVSIKV